MPDMPSLAAAGFSTCLSPALGGWLVQAITRRRFAAVLAVLGELVFQGLNSGFQRPDEFRLSVKQCHDCLFPLLAGDLDFFRCRQRIRLHALYYPLPPFEVKLSSKSGS